MKDKYKNVFILDKKQKKSYKLIVSCKHLTYKAFRMFYYTIFDNKVQSTFESEEIKEKYYPDAYTADGSMKDYQNGYYNLVGTQLIKKTGYQYLKQKFVNAYNFSKLYLAVKKNKRIKHLKRKKNSIILGLLVFFYILLDFDFIIINLPKDKDWIDLFSAFTSFLTVIGAFIAVIYTAKTYKQQKQQWLYEEFIRKESNVLLEFRDILQNAESAVLWFCFLQEEIIHPIKNSFSPPVFDKSNIIESYKKLYDLNVFYNNHQVIFRKHNLTFNINYLISILHSLYGYISIRNSEDARYIYSFKNEEKFVYRLNHYYLLHEGLSMHLLPLEIPTFLGKPDNIDDETYKLILKRNKNNSKEIIEEYKYLAHNKYYDLKQTLELLTTFHDPSDEEKLKSFSIRNFPKYDDIKK